MTFDENWAGGGGHMTGARINPGVRVSRGRWVN